MNNELLRKMMNKKIETLRTNNIVAWLFAVSMGLLFRYIYGVAKNSILAGVRSYFASSSTTTPEIDNVFFIIKFNFAIDLASSFIAALVCGALLVYIFREKAMTFCLGSILVFLVSSSRLWRFWKYPETGNADQQLNRPPNSGAHFHLHNMAGTEVMSPHNKRLHGTVSRPVSLSPLVNRNKRADIPSQPAINSNFAGPAAS